VRLRRPVARGGVSKKRMRYLKRKSTLFACEIASKLSNLKFRVPPPPRCRAPRPCCLPSFRHPRPELRVESHDEEQRRGSLNQRWAQGSRVKSIDSFVFFVLCSLRAKEKMRKSPHVSRFRPPNRLVLAPPARRQHRREATLARFGASDW
jgi:hypothetical protein